jgi:hypothetical protein
VDQASDCVALPLFLAEVRSALSTSHPARPFAGELLPALLKIAAELAHPARAQAATSWSYGCNHGQPSITETMRR